MNLSHAWIAVVIVLTMFVAALEVMTLEGQTPVLTNSVSTQSQTTTPAQLITSTLTQVI